MGITVLNRAFEVLTLDLQGEVLAIDASYVREILDLVPITQVPNSQPFVNGLINVRGKVVPLADLRLKLGMERSETTIDSRIVVVEVELDGAPTTVGLRADKVYEVTELASASVTEAPKIGMRWRPEFIRCIGKRGDDFVIVLNLPAILATGLNKQSDGDPKEDSAAA